MPLALMTTNPVSGSRALTLPHPAGGTLRAVAPLPAHMRETWKFFGFDLDADTDPLFEPKGRR